MFRFVTIVMQFKNSKMRKSKSGGTWRRLNKTMDNPTTHIRKGKTLQLSTFLATFLFLIFVGCVLATGLLVYHFSYRSPYSNETTKNVPPCDESVVPVEHQQTSNGASSSHKVPTVPSTTSIASMTTTTEKKKTEDSVDNVRLPTSIRPHSYYLKLIPFITEGNFTFHGEVSILLNVTETTKNITLHSEDLNIDIVRVAEKGEVPQNASEITLVGLQIVTSKNFLILRLDRELTLEKQYVLTIQFRGNLNNQLVGFYKSSYQVDNQTRWIAATQFQATDARKAFPCFDEPALKAKFRISIARFKNMSTLSNMRILPNQKGEPVQGLPDFEWDHYEESLPMSTYLLAFVVSDFEFIKNGSFSVYARRSALQQAKYSSEIGPAILKYFEDFFGIKYPLPKMDMVALPDFSAGAMENWGLITYRESILLYKEGVSSKGNLQKIAECVAHELAHQWFGNLVTPSWWTDLWLNEGFACYAEYLGANSVSPEWKIMDQFVINNLQKAFKLDALKTSHPISEKVNNPDEINNIFDEISYSKGAALIRMMQNFLTNDVFKRGLNKYLNSKKYSSAEQDDLWKVLTEQSYADKVLDNNLTIKTIMDTWTLQSNFPLITATRNYRNSSVLVTQEIFTMNKSDSKQKLWWVPVTYMTPSNETKLLWMPPQEHIVIDINLKNTEHLIVNVNQTGYYRVNYDLENWKLIINNLQAENGYKHFDSKNRAQLLDDAFKLAYSGYVDYDVALNLSLYLSQEREYVPWAAALDNLGDLENVFILSEHFYLYKKYIFNLIEPFYKKLGLNELDTDDQLTIYSRTIISGTACRLGHRDCVGQAVQQFQNWKNSLDPDKYNLISPNLRFIVYCTVIRVGDEEEWNFIWDQYLKTNVANDRDILLSSLGCSEKVWILKRFLKRSITRKGGIRKQDVPNVFYSVSDNVIGRDVAFNFLINNFQQLTDYFGFSSTLLDAIVRVSTNKLQTRREVDQFKQFVETEKDSLGLALFSSLQNIETVEHTAQWIETYFEHVVNWLINYT